MNQIKLYNGDCLEVMQQLIDKGVKVDAIITDIPYGTTKCTWDIVIPFDKMWECLKKLRKDTSPIVLFGNEPFSSFLRASNISEYKYDWYWQKERPTNIFQIKKRPGKVIENICVFYKSSVMYVPQMTVYKGAKRTNKVKDGKLGVLIDSGNKKPKEYEDIGSRYPLSVLKFTRDVLTSNLHPTQKPLALMEYLVKTYTNVGDTVLDFTMGAGTTGVACRNLNRNFIGIELNKKYFNIAKERIERVEEGEVNDLESKNCFIGNSTKLR